MFRSAFLRRGDPSRGVLLSSLLHVMAATAIISAPLYDFGPVARFMRPEEPPPEREILYYSMNDLLPLVSPPKPMAPAASKPPAVRESVPVKLAFRPAQEIISKQPEPDNRRQTLLQPELPRLEIREDMRVPNIIRWSEPNLPAPAIPVALRRPQPKPAPPKPQPPLLEMPDLPRLASTNPNATAMPLPVATVESPRLPVPVRIVRQPAQEAMAAIAVPATAEVPRLPLMAGDVGSTPSMMPSLVAISVVPAPPADVFVPPAGNRFGEFAASPAGSGEESSGVSSLREAGASGDGEGVPDDDNARIRLPGISIRGGSGAVSSKGGRGGGESDLRKLMASLSRPTLTPGTMAGTAGTVGVSAGIPAIESGFFGSRRVYTVYMNMPNLTSASGSWVLRFAELAGPGNAPEEAGDLTTPEAVRKVDPMYVASAMRERVQGMVTLAAMVLKDGTLANIRVVDSLDPRLDSSAVAALTQWRFRPASKNGTPIDLEVLIQIPFRTGSL